MPDEFTTVNKEPIRREKIMKKSIGGSSCCSKVNLVEIFSPFKIFQTSSILIFLCLIFIIII